MIEFLTEEELIALTGKKQKSQIVKWLSKKRFRFAVSADGHARVDKRYLPIHKGKAAFSASKRRTAKLQRTPKWCDEDAIKRLHIEAATVSKKTGILHHVDHIIPLQGRLVSGLHVPENLQIIPADQNFKKSANYTP